MKIISKISIVLMLVLSLANAGDYFLGGGVGGVSQKRQFTGENEKKFSNANVSLLLGWNSSTSINDSYGHCTGLVCKFQKGAVRAYLNYDYNFKQIHNVSINGDIIFDEVLFVGLGYNYAFYDKEFTRTEKMQRIPYWAVQAGIGNISAKHGFEAFFKLPFNKTLDDGFVKLSPGYSFGLRYIYNFKD